MRHISGNAKFLQRVRRASLGTRLRASYATSVGKVIAGRAGNPGHFANSAL